MRVELFRITEAPPLSRVVLDQPNHIKPTQSSLYDYF